MYCRAAAYTYNMGHPLSRDVLFCFLSEVRLLIGLHSSCSISPTVSGTWQKCSTKHHKWGDAPDCRSALQVLWTTHSGLTGSTGLSSTTSSAPARRRRRRTNRDSWMKTSQRSSERCCRNSLFSHLSTVQSISVIMTVLGPEKIVTISECHNNRWVYSAKLPSWTSMVDKRCHKKHFVTISAVTITETDCTWLKEKYCKLLLSNKLSYQEDMHGW